MGRLAAQANSLVNTHIDPSRNTQPLTHVHLRSAESLKNTVFFTRVQICVFRSQTEFIFK